MTRKTIILFVFTITTLFVKSQQTITPAINDSTLIAFTSDTQAPMWVETLWLKSHQNKKATQRLFSDIQNKDAGSLFLLGDVVNLGYSDKQWKPMDKYLHNLRTKGMGVYAVLGNHEVMGQASKGETKFQKRFPEHVRTGYLQVKDSVAIVLLNSNFNKLTKKENEEQIAWYKNTLKNLDADSAIKFIISGCHHSPYTNSKIVGPSISVQQNFVPAFLASKKSTLFLSGHCHGFEHYKVSGKDFMVIGGGGGLHQPLKQGKDCFQDLASDYKPLFHYITIRRSAIGLQVTSFKLDKEYKGFEEGFACTINGNANTKTSDLASTIVTPTGTH